MSDRFLQRVAELAGRTAITERRAIALLLEIAALHGPDDARGAALALAAAELDLNARDHEAVALSCFDDTPLPGELPKGTDR